jgi:hypothetical protein
MCSTLFDATTLLTLCAAPGPVRPQGALHARPPGAFLHCRVLVIVLLGSLMGLAMPGHSKADDVQNATLRGLSGVRVLVEPLDSKMERAGLTKEQIQTDVEFQLRQAGVRVLTEEERQGVRGTPALSVKVDGLLSYNSQGLAAYTLSVEAYQDARLAANGASALVMTWRVSSISLVGSANLPTGIRNAVRALVDQFIDAYRRVNPQPASSLAPPATSTRPAGSLAPPATSTRPAGSLAPPATSTRRALIHHVQERLQVGGYNPGPLDGALGRQTREALRGFQKAKGLRPTGELDAATLNALGVQ